MLKLGLSLLSFFVSVSALATVEIPAPPPTEVEKSLTYKDLLPYFNSGVPATEALLLGNWKEVAIVSLPNCQNMTANQSDWSGNKNSDGSIPMLDFGYQYKEVPGSAPILKVFSVIVSNLGSKTSDQGPYKTASEEPQFSVWVYLYGSTWPSKKGYYGFTCRIVNGNRNQLICGTRLYWLGEMVPGSDVAKCAPEKIGAIRLYTR